ncbi:glycerophosphodiester phosphodiesterase [Leucobacter weissii]|uniref:glycerophosphodiester phosphodiesterase n=1 Tax=Leucobacter weissii TaxID=1983706 RepID=A0A939SAQ2_9MICO|nr:glycerophosphodiester phosphodiesterase family protein [Leucobacter weissii]MBO1902187.1 glycerophosphodiester phosphodiesterase [Leucobacter weissii]
MGAPPLIIAHRGASGRRPEHTASAYRLALAGGAGAVEPDIVVSRDGVLVVRHENELSGTTDVATRPGFAERRTTRTVDGRTITGWFAEDLDWSELATLRARERLPGLRPENAALDGTEPVLRLRDLLELIDRESERLGARPAVVIELKHARFLRAQGHDLVALLERELSECGWADRPERVIVESFELEPLERLRDRGLPARLVFLIDHDGAPADAPGRGSAGAGSYAWYRSEAGLDALRDRVDGVSLAKQDILADPATVARAQARGLLAYTWTLRPENAFLDPAFRRGSDPAVWGNWRGEWSRILGSGVDGVFADHPELVVQLTSNALPAR